MRRLAVRFTLSLLVATITLPALAGEGRIPIWEPLLIEPGQEGSYYLTRDITQAPGVPAIEVVSGTGAVEIDLNGFTITGASSGTRDLIWAQGAESLTVRNGTLIGTASGDAVSAYSCENVVIEDIHARGIESQVAFNLDRVTHFTIRRSTIDRWSICVKITNGGQGAIDDNQIRTCDGIQAAASNVSVRNNRLQHIGPAIQIDTAGGTCLVEGNLVRETVFSDQDGIVIDSNMCNVLNNVIKLESSGDGIRLDSSFGVVRDNAVMAAGNGLVVTGDANQIVDNVFTYNASAGVWFTSSADDNTYGHNTVRWNLAAPGPCVFTPPACGAPDVCDDGIGNTSFGDNMGPGAGC